MVILFQELGHPSCLSPVLQEVLSASRMLEVVLNNSIYRVRSSTQRYGMNSSITYLLLLSVAPLNALNAA